MNNQELNNHYINSQEQNDQNIDLNTGSFYTDDQKAGMPETVHAVVQNGPDKRKHKKRWLSISITIVICIIGSALGWWAASSFAQKVKKDQWEKEMQQRLDQLDESVPEIEELGGLSDEFVQAPVGSVSQVDQEVMESESTKEQQAKSVDFFQRFFACSAAGLFYFPMLHLILTIAPINRTRICGFDVPGGTGSNCGWNISE